MSLTPPAEVLACADLPAGATVENVGGATGQLWKVTTPDGTYALRWAPSRETVERHLAAMKAAAAAGLPVPEVIWRRSVPTGDVVLLSWLGGATIYDALRAAPARADELGRLMGTAQRELHQTPAPAGLGSAVDAGRRAWPDGLPEGPAAVPSGAALLHLDWHGYNLLVDDGELSGIIDWDNARAGHPLLDVARTHALLTIDPALAQATAYERGLVAELAEGWAEGYGPQARTIPAACLAWVGGVMLVDLARRYTADPSALDELRLWTAHWAERSRRDA